MCLWLQNKPIKLRSSNQIEIAVNCFLTLMYLQSQPVSLYLRKGYVITGYDHIDLYENESSENSKYSNCFSKQVIMNGGFTTNVNDQIILGDDDYVSVTYDYYPFIYESLLLQPFLTMKSLHLEVYSNEKLKWIKYMFPNLTELRLDSSLNESSDEPFISNSIFLTLPKLEIFHALLSILIYYENDTSFISMLELSVTLSEITLDQFCTVFPNLLKATLILEDIYESEEDEKVISNEKVNNLILILNKENFDEFGVSKELTNALIHFPNLLKLELKLTNEESITEISIIDTICLHCKHLMTLVLPYGSCSPNSMKELLMNCTHLTEIQGIFININDFNEFIDISQSYGQNLKKIFFGIEDYDKNIYQNQIHENIIQLLIIFNKFNHSINIGFNYLYLEIFKPSLGYYSNLTIENYDFKN